MYFYEKSKLVLIDDRYEPVTFFFFNFHALQLRFTVQHDITTKAITLLTILSFQQYRRSGQYNTSI